MILGVKNYSTSTWKQIKALYDYLPIAAKIGDKIFCIHGGMAPDFLYIRQLEELNLPLSSDNSLIESTLWSSPTDDPGVEYRDSPRGMGVDFGMSIAEQFLVSNNIDLMFRGHNVYFLH